MLWVMFLACMATSVFFSFDSRFNVVFPQGAARARRRSARAEPGHGHPRRHRAPRSRASRPSSREQLFESEGWRGYEAQLTSSPQAAQERAAARSRRYFNQQIEDRQPRHQGTAGAHHHGAEPGRCGPRRQEASLTDELARSRASGRRSPPSTRSTKTELDKRAGRSTPSASRRWPRTRASRARGKVGQGPGLPPAHGRARQAAGRPTRSGEQRVKDAKKRLDAAEASIAQIERELTGVDGEIAKLQGRGADRRAAHRDQLQDGGARRRAQPRRPGAGSARLRERRAASSGQEPTAGASGQVQQLCSQLLQRHAHHADDQRDKVRPASTAIPSRRARRPPSLFALNAGTKTFKAELRRRRQARRAQDRRMPCSASRASASPTAACRASTTDELRTKISFTEMTRDDNAHRFVVSWNAFSDGNRLAYLALAHRHRHRLADLHDGPVRRQCRALAAVGRAEQQGAQLRSSSRPSSRRRCCRIPSRMRGMTHPCHAADHATRRVHGRGAPGAARPDTQRNGVLNGAQRRRDHQRRGVRRGRPTAISCAASCSSSCRSWPRRRSRADKANVDLAELERIVGVALLPRRRPECRDGAALHASHQREARVHRRDQARGGDAAEHAHGAQRAQRGRDAGARAARRRGCHRTTSSTATLQDAGAHPGSHVFDLRRGPLRRSPAGPMSGAARRRPSSFRRSVH